MNGSFWGGYFVTAAVRGEWAVEQRNGQDARCPSRAVIFFKGRQASLYFKEPPFVLRRSDVFFGRGFRMDSRP